VNDDQTELLRDVRESVAGIKVAMDHLQRSMDVHAENSSNVRDAVTALRLKIDDHATRIEKIETQVGVQGKWQTRLGGAWVGVTLIISVITTLIALGWSIYKH
jgi:hypothetical protein